MPPPAFQSVLPLRSICLRVSGAVAPSAPPSARTDGRTLPQGSRDVSHKLRAWPGKSTGLRSLGGIRSHATFGLLPDALALPVVGEFFRGHLEAEIDPIRGGGLAILERNRRHELVGTGHPGTGPLELT